MEVILGCAAAILEDVGVVDRQTTNYNCFVLFVSLHKRLSSQTASMAWSGLLNRPACRGPEAMRCEKYGPMCRCDNIEKCSARHVWTQPGPV